MRLTIKTKLAATFAVVVAMSAGGMMLALTSLGQLNGSMDDLVNGVAAASRLGYAGALDARDDEPSHCVAQLAPPN